eukprot:1614693-Amphidinium_carterae.2
MAPCRPRVAHLPQQQDHCRREASIEADSDTETSRCSAQIVNELKISHTAKDFIHALGLSFASSAGSVSVPDFIDHVPIQYLDRLWSGWRVGLKLLIPTQDTAFLIIENGRVDIRDVKNKSALSANMEEAGKMKLAAQILKS